MSSPSSESGCGGCLSILIVLAIFFYIAGERGKRNARDVVDEEIAPREPTSAEVEISRSADAVRIESETGTPLYLTPMLVERMQEHVRRQRMAGVSTEEIDAGVITINGRSFRMGEIVNLMAENYEATLAAIEYESTPGERGIGGVLLSGKIPRKVLARRSGLYVLDDQQLPSRPFRTNIPYFVFEDYGELLKVGTFQDSELCQGWVRSRECHPWSSRRLVYPGDPTRASRSLNPGATGRLTTFDPTQMMPWPVIMADPGGTMLAVADLHEIGGPIQVIPILEKWDPQVFVMFTERELTSILTRLLQLQGLIESGRVEPTKIVRVLGDFLTQNSVDFCDFDEIQSVVERFPGGTPDFLMRKEMRTAVHRLAKQIERQIDDMSDLMDASACFNEARGVYIFPWTIME